MKIHSFHAWLLVLVALSLSGCGPQNSAGAASAPTLATVAAVGEIDPSQGAEYLTSTPDLEPQATLQTQAEPVLETSPTLPLNTPESLASPTRTQTPTSSPATATPESLTCRPDPLTGTASDICYLDQQLALERPIGPGGRNTVDVTYRYGSTQSGQRDPHNGVEFLNSFGTPVLAAADGEVVTAENDYNQKLGLYYNFYGNLIVLEHHLPGHTVPVYTLYGHLAEMDVRPGQTVKAGQKIGLVGIGGAATGSHLHFEVRYGENSYKASRNPEIWLKPLLDETGQPMGALAGRILDAGGNSLENSNIVLERLSAKDGYTVRTTYILTYDEKWMRGNLPWEETFGVSDLPAGYYRVRFVQSGMQDFLIEIKPGQLAMATFRVH